MKQNIGKNSTIFFDNFNKVFFVFVLTLDDVRFHQNDKLNVSSGNNLEKNLYEN
jgi:hypothetical protein